MAAKTRVVGCVVAEVGAGINSEKHVIRKTAGSDPFTDYSVGDLVTVYNSDYSKSGDMYVIQQSTADGGDYYMCLGATTAASHSVSEAGKSENVSPAACENWDSGYSGWNNSDLWTLFQTDHSVPGPLSTNCCPGFGTTLDDGGWLVEVADDAKLFVKTGNVVERLWSGYGLGAWNSKYSLCGGATARCEGRAATFGDYMGLYGQGDDLWDVFGRDQTDVIIGIKGDEYYTGEFGASPLSGNRPLKVSFVNQGTEVFGE